MPCFRDFGKRIVLGDFDEEGAADGKFLISAAAEVRLKMTASGVPPRRRAGRFTSA
jgi:hypothetical protein